LCFSGYYNNDDVGEGECVEFIGLVDVKVAIREGDRAKFEHFV